MNPSREAEIKYLVRRVVGRTHLDPLVVTKVLRALDRDKRLTLVNDHGDLEPEPEVEEHHFEPPVDKELDEPPKKRFGPETIQGQILKVFYEATKPLTTKEACALAGRQKSHRMVTHLKKLKLVEDVDYRFDEATSTRSFLIKITERGRTTYEESVA